MVRRLSAFYSIGLFSFSFAWNHSSASLQIGVFNILFKIPSVYALWNNPKDKRTNLLSNYFDLHVETYVPVQFNDEGTLINLFSH